MNRKKTSRMKRSVPRHRRELSPIDEFTLPLKVIGQAVAYPFFVLFHRLKRNSK